MISHVLVLNFKGGWSVSSAITHVRNGQKNAVLKCSYNFLRDLTDLNRKEKWSATKKEVYSMRENRYLLLDCFYMIILTFTEEN